MEATEEWERKRGLKRGVSVSEHCVGENVRSVEASHAMPCMMALEAGGRLTIPAPCPSLPLSVTLHYYVLLLVYCVR